MALLIYDQIWSMSAWLESSIEITAIGDIRVRFAVVPQIQDLLDQGFVPTISKRHDIHRDNVHFTMTFDIPESVRTFMLLKYPQPVEEIDFDSMITIKGRASNVTPTQTT